VVDATRLVEERERACDEEVLGLGKEPETYAESILAVCKMYLGAPLPCVPGMAGANLRRRIERILSPVAVHSLNRRRKILLAWAAGMALACPIAIGVMRPVSARAQAQTGGPMAFEVASIKPAQLPSAGRPVWVGIRSDPEQVTYSFQSVLWLISMAYNVSGERISGGPDWMHSDFYNIVAKLPPGTPAARVPLLLQRLLAERFGLVLRHEMRDSRLYAMVLGKGGPKFKLSPEPQDPAGQPRAVSSVPLLLSANMATMGICCGRAALHHVTMTEFADMLALQTDRPIIDRTGLPGAFEISLHWAAENSPAGDASAEPSIYTAVEEQLGLRLEPRRAPLQYLFVEHVEKPSAN
jgi:bla regulator protein blaR1